MKVVINKCYGGFGLSHKATMRYAELKGIKLYPHTTDGRKKSGVKEWKEGDREPFFLMYYTAPQTGPKTNDDEYFDRPGREDRADPHLIQVVEELGEEANGKYAELSIVEVPDDVAWEIEEYDGTEWIAEKHRTWS